MKFLCGLNYFMSSTRGSSFLGLVKPIQLVSTWGQILTFISRDMRGQKYGNWRPVLQVESIQTHNVYGQTSGAQCCSGGFCPCSLTPLSKFTRTCVITCASLMFLLADGTNRLRIGEHWHRLTPPVSLPLTRSKTLIIFHPSLRRPRTSVSRPLFEQWPRVLRRVEEPETWSYSLLVIGEMFAELWGRCRPPSLDSFAKQNLYTYDPYVTNRDILRQQLWSVTFSNDRRGERVRLWLLNVTFNPGMEQDLQDMWGRPSERESRSSTWPTTQSQLPPTAWCAELLKASFGCKYKLTVLMWVCVSGADKLESSVWKVTTVPFDFLLLRFAKCQNQPASLPQDMQTDEIEAKTHLSKTHHPENPFSPCPYLVLLSFSVVPRDRPQQRNSPFFLSLR